MKHSPLLLRVCRPQFLGHTPSTSSALILHSPTPPEALLHPVRCARVPRLGVFDHSIAFLQQRQGDHPLPLYEAIFDGMATACVEQVSAPVEECSRAHLPIAHRLQRRNIRHCCSSQRLRRANRDLYHH